MSVVSRFVDRRRRIIEQDAISTRPIDLRGAREHHEIRGAAGHKERIIWLQGNEDRA